MNKEIEKKIKVITKILNSFKENLSFEEIMDNIVYINDHIHYGHAQYDDFGCDEIQFLDIYKDLSIKLLNILEKDLMMKSRNYTFLRPKIKLNFYDVKLLLIIAYYEKNSDGFKMKNELEQKKYEIVSKIIEDVKNNFSKKNLEKQLEIMNEYLPYKHRIISGSYDNFYCVEIRGDLDEEYYDYSYNEILTSELINILNKDLLVNEEPIVPINLYELNICLLLALNKMKDDNEKLKKNKELEAIKKLENEKNLIIEKLENENRELKERLNYFENKQANLDDIIQEKISQKLRDYQEKMEKFEKENKELKEQLGFYE